jgi:photosystem II stability/assembly factor-like uncharacterized protein
VATWRTGDGGTTWSAPTTVAAAVPRASYAEQDPAGGGARALRMLDERRGYAFNPDLYATADGGRTWERVPQPSKVAGVHVAGSSVWTFQRGCPAVAECDAVLSAVEGDALRPLPLPATRGAPAVVRRADERRGYVVSWDAPEGPKAAFRRTADGGRTWTDGTHPCPDATATLISAGAGRPLWLVCTTPAGTKRAFQSTDEGGTWRRLGDPPAAGVVTDFVARSASTAYLTTQVPGQLLVTTDGGATWQTTTGSGKGYGYGNLDVVDERHAFAMGDAGLLWRTTDGTRWERLALPPGAPRPAKPTGTAAPADAEVTYTGLWFTDTRHGWAAGQRCADGRCRYVLRATADGGDTWSTVGAPRREFAESSAGPGVGGRVVFAPDRRTGYLYDPGLHVTHDGGATWRDLGYTGVSDVAIRDGAVWLLTHGRCDGDECKPFVRRATLGSDAFTGPENGTGDEVGPGRAELTVASGRVAYLVGDREQYVWATEDAGRTWLRRGAPCLNSVVREASLTGGTLWVVCGGEGGGGNQPHRIALSTDGARTWTERPSRDGSGYVTQVVALSPEVAWRADDGLASGIRSTADGGITWRAHDLPAETESGAGPYAFQVLDARHGFALFAPNVFLRMTDGRTWERMRRP